MFCKYKWLFGSTSGSTFKKARDYEWPLAALGVESRHSGSKSRSDVYKKIADGHKKIDFKGPGLEKGHGFAAETSQDYPRYVRRSNQACNCCRLRFISN